MTALSQLPLAALRNLTAEDTDQSLVGQTGQPTMIPPSILSQLLSQGGNAPGAPSAPPQNAGANIVPPSALMQALGQGGASPAATPPVNPAVARQHALWLAIQQAQQQNQLQNQAGSTPGSLGSPGPFGAFQPSSPSPTSGIAGPPPAQVGPGSVPSDAVDPELANATAEGSPNNPLAKRMHQAFLKDQAEAEAASDLKQASLGVSPIDGQPTIGESYDATKSGPYGFNPDVMAGGIPKGSVDVQALVDKDKLAKYDTLHPDFAARFNGGAPVFDDRGPLSRAISEPSNIALPAHRIMSADRMTQAEIDALPPDLRRAVVARNADIAAQQKLEQAETARVKGDTESERHWHGDVAMTDKAWNAARDRQRTTDNMNATKHRLAADKRHDEQFQLSKAFAQQAANNPFGNMSPQQLAWMDPSTVHAVTQAQQETLNRQSHERIAQEQRADERLKLKYGEYGKMMELAATGNAEAIAALPRLKHEIEQATPLGAAGQQASGNFQSPAAGTPAAPEVSVFAPPSVPDDAIKQSLEQVPRSALADPRMRQSLLDSWRAKGVTPDRLLRYAKDHPGRVGFLEGAMGDADSAKYRGSLESLIQAILAGTAEGEELNKSVTSEGKGWPVGRDFWFGPRKEPLVLQPEPKGT